MDITTYKEILRSIDTNCFDVLKPLTDSIFNELKNFGLNDWSLEKLLMTFSMLASTSEYINSMMLEVGSDIALIEIVYRYDLNKFDINIKNKTNNKDYEYKFYSDNIDYFKNILSSSDYEMLQIVTTIMNNDMAFLKSFFSIKKYFLEINSDKESEVRTNEGFMTLLSFAKMYGGGVICTPQFVKYDNETVFYKQVEKYFNKNFEEIVLRMDKSGSLKKHSVGLRL